MVQRLNGRISRLRAMTIASSGRHVTGPAQMRKTYDAIARHDPLAAAAACREHVPRPAQIAQNRLSEQPEGGSPWSSLAACYHARMTSGIRILVVDDEPQIQ